MCSETESSVLLSHQIARPAAKASRASTDQSQSIEGAVVCFAGRNHGRSGIAMPAAFSLFIFSHFKWLNILVQNEPCLCVRLSVCLSQPFIWKLFGRFWWNLDHMILRENWDDAFLRFWKFCFNDVITAILYVLQCGTLTVAILLRFYSKLQTRCN